MTVDIPDGWLSTDVADGGLLATENVNERFASSVTAFLDASRDAVFPDPVAAATSLLLASVLIDVRSAGTPVDVVVCHLVGSISATAWQRQLVVSEGLLVVTFTAATSRWSEQCALAGEVFDSIRVAA